MLPSCEKATKTSVPSLDTKAHPQSLFLQKGWPERDVALDAAAMGVFVKVFGNGNLQESQSRLLVFRDGKLQRENSDSIF